MSEIAMKVREMFTKGDQERDAGNTTPEDVERFDNIQYGPDEKWHVLDVYRPKGVKGKLPVIIILSVVVAAGVYYLFVYGLDMVLPAGILG